MACKALPAGLAILPLRPGAALLRAVVLACDDAAQPGPGGLRRGEQHDSRYGRLDAVRR